MINRLINLMVRCVVTIVIIVFTIILVRAFDSRKLPDLQTWHRTLLENEYSVAKSERISGLEEYIALEDRLFAELGDKIYANLPPEERLPLSRYTSGSPVDPEEFSRNWNRSFELIPGNMRGGVLMLHGLTDSPYSMRHLADMFKSQGFYVLSLRMPGHGTIPSALLDATWHDWMAVVRMGARHVRARIGEDQPFYLVGYSNGGALSIKYIIESLENESLPTPERVILLSPMLGVTFFARFSDWHKTLSWLPYFEKFHWLDIYPEYDPFKYNSFPKSAGEQSFLLTQVVGKELNHLANTGKISQFPPILTFQSLVDATILTHAIVDKLYNKLSANHHELVFFDVNRLSEVDSFFQERHDQLLQRLTEMDDLPYTLTILTNANSASREVVVKTGNHLSTPAAGQSLTMEWPRKVYSLSHVAIPFPDDDLLYGPMNAGISNSGVNIGTFSPRGEKGVLNVPADLLMRLRYNPFYDYMEQRILESIATNLDRGE